MPDTLLMPAVALVTLGCPKNEVDSDRMAAALESAGYRVVEDMDDASVVVVNTCSFISDATEESITTVLTVARDWLPEAGERHIIVAGCMPSRYGDELSGTMPEVSAFVPVSDESGIVEAVASLTGVAPRMTGRINRRRDVGVTAYLRISDGCHRRCAYCTIPSIRGPFRSVPLEEIIAEADELIAAGAREVVLIGQDTTEYGRDLSEEVSLADVVNAVAGRPGLTWLRIMYAQPEGVSDELIHAMAGSPVVCNYLDMPLQHASAEVLRRMRRSGSGDEFLKLTMRLRVAMPDIALRTTLIAGFPGETRADVATLHAFLEDASFDYVGVFPYSPEEGTAAAQMESQIPVRTRRARAQRLRDLSDRIGHLRVEALVGQVLEVLVEGVDPDDGVVFGRWRGQAPEIDGVVLLDRGVPGDVVQARIVDSLGYDLEGEVI